MFSLFLTPYFLLLSIDMPGWAQLLLTIVMGVGMAGVGMNVMHVVITAHSLRKNG